VLFKFACDESYDSPRQPPFDPKTYVVAGFFSEERIWEKVERRWKNANARKNEDARGELWSSGR
jgi:hypothetical protein